MRWDAADFLVVAMCWEIITVGSRANNDTPAAPISPISVSGFNQQTTSSDKFEHLTSFD